MLAMPGLVDSGADYSVFPAPWAGPLGIDLASCREEDSQTAGGTAKQYLHSQKLTAEIQAMSERVELVAAFSDVLPIALLGRQDFFAAFKVSFDERAQTFRLERY
jgi:hypothetical protein